MAQTKRKRKRKHRGTPAGTVSNAARTGQPRTREEAKRISRDRRRERLDREPSWRGAVNRAAIAAAVFAVLVIVAFGRPVGAGLLLGVLMFALYIPLGYVTDRAIYNFRRRKRGGCPGPPPRGRRAARGTVTVGGVGNCSSCCQHLSVRFSVHGGGVRLSEWAKREGIHYQTAWKWFKQGTLPVPARQTATGTILVDEPRREEASGVALYARVSSSDQREDLDRQVGRLAAWATARGLGVTVTVAEVGSGLNGSRGKLKRLLADDGVGTIVVEHRERLARFGVEYVEAALRAQGRKLVVVEEREVDDDLVGDITEVLTSMCARLYGRRSARRRAERALVAAGEAA